MAVEGKLRSWINGPPNDRTEAEKQSLGKVVIDTLDRREGRGITFPLFAPALSSGVVQPEAAAVLRMQLLITYCQHYLDFAGGMLPTGIRGLSFFDHLTQGFPFNDVPILFELMVACGLAPLMCDTDNQVRTEFLALRTSGMHLEFVRQVQYYLDIISRLAGLLKRTRRGLYGHRAHVIEVLRQFLSEEPRKARELHGATDMLSSAFERITYLIRQGSTSVAFCQAAEDVTMSSQVNTADILFVTTTPIETSAVLNGLRRVARVEPEVVYIGDHTYQCFEDVAGCRTALVQSEMGSGGVAGSLITVYDAIKAVRPRFVVMLGIAFGLKRKKQKLGDILVSKQVMSYELQRIGAGKRIARGDRTHCAARLLDRFRAGALDWRKAKVHFGLLLSGDKLVDSETFTQELLNLEPEAIGGEMEGAGLYSACAKTQTPWIIVKGICDWGDGKKKDQFQQLAANNATELVLSILEKGALGRETL